MKKLVGVIDIGTATVTAAWVARMGGRLCLRRFVCRSRAELATPADILTELGTTKGRLVSVLSGEHVSLRCLKLPFQAQKKIEQAVRFAAEPHLPWDIDDAAVAAVLGQETEGGRELTAAAARKADLDSHLAGLPGLKVCRLACRTSSLLALAQVLRLSGNGRDGVSPAPSVLLGLGHTKTDILVIHAGELRAARSLPYGAGNAQAGEGDVTFAVKDYTTRIGQEVEWLLASLWSDRPADRIWVTGGGSLLDGVIAGLSQSAGLEADRWCPEIDIEETATALDGDQVLALGATAIGAAAQELFGTGVDLQRAALSVRSFGERAGPWLIAGALLGGIALGGWAGANFRRIGELHTRVARSLSAQRAAWRGVFPQRQVPLNVKPVMASELRGLQQLEQDAIPERHRSALDILLDVVRLMPSTARLDDAHIRITQRSVSIQAETSSWEGVEQMEKGISSSPVLEAVGKDIKALAPGRIRINLEVRIKQPGAGVQP